MALKASDINDRVSEKLNDLGATRWPEPELIRAINDGLKLMLEAKPDLFQYSTAVAVQAGSRQTLPTDCYRLMEVGEVKVGSAWSSSPIKIAIEVMDRQRPNWMGMANAAVAEHWLQNKADDDYFYLCPPIATSNTTVRLKYARMPPVVASKTDTLTAPDETINALYYFCMMRALEKDEKFSGSPQAVRFAEMFAQALGIRAQGEKVAQEIRAEEEGS